MRKHKVERIPIPSIEKEDLIDRAINKLKPFNDNGAGFKDTLIYLSIIEDALSKKSEDTCYIFCTNDSKEFSEEILKEFKDLTKKDLVIVPSVVKVKEKLDELIPLDLHLEERNRKIRNLILENIGDVMHTVNQRFPKRDEAPTSMRIRDPYTAIALTSSLSAFNTADNEDKVLGFNYSNIIFHSFHEMEKNKYRVLATLSTNIKYDDNERQTPYYHHSSLNVITYMHSDHLKPLQKNFNVEVECDLDSKMMSIERIGTLY